MREKMEPAHLINVAIEPKNPVEMAQLTSVLDEIVTEDAGLKHSIDRRPGQLILSGPNELSLNMAVDRLQRDFGLNINIGAPQVVYREQLSRRAEIDYTHKKLIGGSKQFARVRIVFEPNGRDMGNAFELALGGDPLPDAYVSGVRRGFESALQSGIRIGSPVVDTRATLIGGACHERDSSVLAFEIAARAATREALVKGGCALLEPIMRVEVTAPQEYEGSVVGDMQSRRGEIMEREAQDAAIKIVALTPLASLLGYINQLRSFTQGQGDHAMRFSHYAVVPPKTPNGHFPSAIALRQGARLA